jgi:hypothetical protein
MRTEAMRGLGLALFTLLASSNAHATEDTRSLAFSILAVRSRNRRAFMEAALAAELNNSAVTK